ncbi:MAG: hypothetical protein QNK59_06335 [Flavobacteriales bacterium]|jgi:hypothetical protein|tara:strand:- start:119 stop:700 length:582 start_codon:yes stop_codon:yes gene_type:complete
MRTKISAILLCIALTACQDSQESKCDLSARYSFNFEQAQYYALPVIDFSFNLSYDWTVRMPSFGKQNFNYYEAARINDDSTGSVLLRVLPFKRQGNYITVTEQAQAQIYRSVQTAISDSWVTERTDTVDQWWVKYGRYEQEPWDYIIAHRLILRDTMQNGLLLELQMQCPADSFDLGNERCLGEIDESFKIYL